MSDKEIHVIHHPIVDHKLNQLRDRNTSSAQFRSLLSDLGFILGYELLHDAKLFKKQIDTPLESIEAHYLDESKICLVSVLRAGNGLLDGFLKLIPNCHVGHIGLSRHHTTYEITEYCFKHPENISKLDVIILDPMLATGHSAGVAIARIKEIKPLSIRYLSLLSAPEGISYVQNIHPDVPLYTASIDSKLNEKKYIVPGLGDAGDRLYNT